MRMFASSLPVWGALALTASATSPFGHPSRATNSTDNELITATWAEIIPSAELNWTDCFWDFKCAKLIVPLDYEDEAAGHTIVPFAVSPADSSDAEDILFNPGGPGGSGIKWIVNYENALQLRELLGPKYNIVSFDPRGVSISDINLDCFPGDSATRDYYKSKHELVIDGNNASIAEVFTDAEGWGKLCSNTHKNDNARYANTMAVVGDILHYTKLRAKALRKDPEEAKTNYFGISYGTIIGTTFASLHPDKVGRFILDGVADNVQWFEGTWKEWILELDGAVNYFFETCYDGKDACAFFKGDKTVDAIKDRFDAILTDIEINPISYYNPAYVKVPVTITVSQIKREIVHVMYYAVNRFTDLARIMFDLETRDAGYFVRTRGLGRGPDDFCTNYTFRVYDFDTALRIIPCNDAAGRNALTLDEYAQLVHYETSRSKYGGEVMASQDAVDCHAYDIRPPASQIFSGLRNLKDGAVKTATPILFVRNMFDPVTPAAWKMSEYFANSVVLTQKTVGHGMNVAESHCRRRYVYDYLASGALPPNGTECEVQTIPFKMDKATQERMQKKKPLASWG